MTGKQPDSAEVEFVCLFCYLPRCMTESKWCPFNRYHRLKRAEERGRAAGRKWISQGQIKRMIEEIGEQNAETVVESS